MQLQRFKSVRGLVGRHRERYLHCVSYRFRSECKVQNYSLLLEVVEAGNLVLALGRQHTLSIRAKECEEVQVDKDDNGRANRDGEISPVIYFVFLLSPLLIEIADYGEETGLKQTGEMA